MVRAILSPPARMPLGTRGGEHEGITQNTQPF